MLTRWGGLDRTLAMLDEFQRRMNDLFSEYGTTTRRGFLVGPGTYPLVNLYDAGEHLMVRAYVPGLSDQDINITGTQETITISGERKVDPPEGYSVYRQERRSLQFSRSFGLPCRVDLEKATATVKDGVLDLTLPKVPEAKPRQISVKAR